MAQRLPQELHQTASNGKPRPRAEAQGHSCKQGEHRRRSCDDVMTPAGVQRSLDDTEEESAVSQRNLIYIVGAIILILVIAYFLGLLGFLGI